MGLSGRFYCSSRHRLFGFAASTGRREHTAFAVCISGERHLRSSFCDGVDHSALSTLPKQNSQMVGRSVCGRTGYGHATSPLCNPGLDSSISPQQRQRATPIHPLHSARVVPDDHLLAICPALLLHFVHPRTHHSKKDRTKAVVA